MFVKRERRHFAPRSSSATINDLRSKADVVVVFFSPALSGVFKPDAAQCSLAVTGRKGRRGAKPLIKLIVSQPWHSGVTRCAAAVSHS